MFSQDEYRGKFSPSTVIDCIAADATALLINYTWWAASYPPSSMVLLRWTRHSSVWIGASIVHSALPNPLSDLDLERLFFILDSEHPSPPPPPPPQ